MGSLLLPGGLLVCVSIEILLGLILLEKGSAATGRQSMGSGRPSPGVGRAAANAPRPQSRRPPFKLRGIKLWRLRGLLCCGLRLLAASLFAAAAAAAAWTKWTGVARVVQTAVAVL
jgi:hypothetical protein